jgi:hypothetical protein
MERRGREGRRRGQGERRERAQGRASEHGRAAPRGRGRAGRGRGRAQDGRIRNRAGGCGARQPQSAHKGNDNTRDGRSEAAPRRLSSGRESPRATDSKQTQEPIGTRRTAVRAPRSSQWECECLPRATRNAERVQWSLARSLAPSRARAPLPYALCPNEPPSLAQPARPHNPQEAAWRASKRRARRAHLERVGRDETAA